MTLAVDAVGAAAAVCSMTSFVPQLVKIAQAHDARGVSLRMYLVTVTGFSLWTLYGSLVGRWPIIAANAVCLAMAATILVLKWRLDRPSVPRD